ncbi:response regulator transcription factor [Rubrobacter calidifluminis]|uniref:response regulator transcription factor n=1 Tax=Rubrobacter calidifluminis TaxID=1392640 RepID=UPI00235FBEC9|nr:response regulator transcription factor [Rubrobacter calidifluminis]
MNARKGTILVVDDERDVVGFVRDVLEDEGYRVIPAFDGEEAIEEARRSSPDLVLLDIMMPKVDGYTVCRALREEMEIPIILLTARQSETDKVLGFGMGADDYVVKPFGTRELIARVEAHLRRERRLLSRREGAPAVAFGGLSIDMIRREVRYLGKRVPLTRREFDLVRFLALHPRQVFSREQIYDRVWEMDSMGSLETVTEHVKRVRKKLAEAAPETSYIETVWGVGYRWNPGPQ